ncbi:MAG: type I-C CRISPR-associated protein Cas8c/Csd1 [Sporomusaceae bacterium]|nr:type I-C CRISPR-associated protein Cas8c/Csd1 [Sporomusaceae bacterium]
MILQALNEHYQRLLDEPDSGVAPPGYSPAKVSHALVIAASGQLLDILPLSDREGKRSVPKVLLVPEQVKRTSGIAANILCDSISYVLGFERDKQGAVRLFPDKYLEFYHRNEQFLSGIECREAAAVNAFLAAWNPACAVEHPVVAAALEGLTGASNFVFKLDGVPGYVHEHPDIRAAWEAMEQGAGNVVAEQCLILGKTLQIARIHPLIKGVAGAQSSGASLVSFNAEAFTSYGKSQSFNAPVSQQAAFAYGTALNYLIASDRNRVRLADTTMVFWADKKNGKAEEAVLSWCLDPIEPAAATEENTNWRLAPEAVLQAKTIFERVKAGLPAGDSAFDRNTRCYMLGLSPNAARLSVRFWQVSEFGDVLAKVAQHYTDMEIDGSDRIGGMISPWRTLKALAVQEDARNIPPLLGGQFLNSMLSGRPYPQSIFQAALLRCRTGGDAGGVSIIRAAVIKAFLRRQYRLQNNLKEEATVTVSLNEGNLNPAYLLGRLFSLLEKVQRDALGNAINATIRDRYFGAASATPGAVFPLLLRLSRHHISKAKYGELIDRQIQTVMNGLSGSEGFPKHLSMEQQGLFVLGYYHQNQANYKKNESIKEGEVDPV